MGWLKNIGVKILGFAKEAFLWVLPALKRILADEMKMAREVVLETVQQVAVSHPEGGKPFDLLQEAVAKASTRLLASGIKVAINDLILIIGATIADNPKLSVSNGDINK
jgi:hypothetical protein